MSHYSILMTGGNSELARRVCRKLISLSEADIILTTRSSSGRPDDIPRSVLWLPEIDLSSEGGVQRLRCAVERHFDGPFHVFSCTGHFPGYIPISELSLGEFRETVESNLTAVFGLGKAVLEVMAARGRGHFVVCSSHTTDHSYPNLSAFSASKAGLENLVRTIANEYASRGLVANTFALSTVNLERERALKPFGDHQNWLPPEQIADELLHLFEAPTSALNGNTLHFYLHSDSYFGEAYMDRNRILKISEPEESTEATKRSSSH